MLHILRLARFGQCVLRHHLVIFGLGIAFFSLFLGKVVGEIRLYNLQDLDDGAASPSLFRKSRYGRLLHQSRHVVILLYQRRTAIVIPEDTDRFAHSRQSQFQLLLRGRKRCVLILTGFCHLSLCLCQLRELGCQFLQLRLELRGLGGRLLNLSADALELVLQLILLLLGLLGLRVAERFLSCIRSSLVLQFFDELLDEGLDLRKWVLAAIGAIAQYSRYARGELVQGSRMLRLCKCFHEINDLVAAALSLGTCSHLKQRVSLQCSPRRRLLQNIDRRFHRLDLLCSGGN
mmetsp:Transcript_5798/g.10650  ORF Transcript_5798/g.10650 Transcript_5798/m.10650 type:complete len:290 (+) Transcript_5798:340-1209(+)